MTQHISVVSRWKINNFEKMPRKECPGIVWHQTINNDLFGKLLLAYFGWWLSLSLLSSCVGDNDATESSAGDVRTVATTNDDSTLFD